MRGQKRKNVFYDDRGFPDQSHDFDVVLRNIDGGTVLRKRRHPAPALDEVAPEFFAKYDESVHGTKLRKELDLSHLSTPVRDKVYRLIQKYWSVFDDKGQFVPVKDYTCVIDTGSAKPIAVKKIHYGPREIPIMRQCITNLVNLNYISQIHDGEWLFKALLAPKPHQEHITSIDQFVWWFCINYIPLNQVTRPIAYPIPRCDSAVNLTFGDGRFMWLWDAPSGYHQIGHVEGPRPLVWCQNRRGYEHEYHRGRHPQLCQIIGYRGIVHGMPAQGCAIPEFITESEEIPYIPTPFRIRWYRRLP